jgi:hydroxymethylglutaryl-CoA reductase
MDEVKNRLPPGFHKQTLAERRNSLRAAFPMSEIEWEGISASRDVLDISDVMVESAVGCVPIPLGIADGFLIDGVEVAIPMAVEEPSVIAAASYAARIVRQDGGFTTWATEPIMSAQVFLEAVGAEGEKRLRACEPRVRAALAGPLASLERRGGGFRGMMVHRLVGSMTMRVDIRIDVRDAMGANRLNTAAELARPILEGESGGTTLMAILTNAAEERRAGARFAIPVQRLAARLPAGMDGAEAARRIAAAASVAAEDPARAVTHNKGIMNGISSLALATMNDTRAIEAAAHAWAARSGRYRGLSSFTAEAGTLAGEMELPLAFAAVGGSVGFHPASRAALTVLGKPDAVRLARIAAALGLAQNLAALLALVTHGIQRGHMRYHAARLAYDAGARGQEARQLAAALAAAPRADSQAAAVLLAAMRAANP